MSRTIFVLSTLASTTVYAGYHANDNAGQLPRVKHSVTIEGGAGVANKNFITPRGVVTAITEEDAAFLKDHKVFRRHADRGFVSFSESDPGQAVDSAVAGMEGRDKSAPLVEEDFQNATENDAKPVAAKKRK